MCNENGAIQYLQDQINTLNEGQLGGEIGDMIDRINMRLDNLEGNDTTN